MRTIIAFTGPKGCGKSTAAKYLMDHGFVRHYFAKSLKEMIKCLGLTEEHVNGGLKETPCHELCGQTPRWAMQSLGTEWGRELIHPDLWVNAWKNTMPKETDIVCDDLRFPNEYSILKEQNGYVVDIIRPGFERDQSHESEAHSLPFDYQIANASTFESLQHQLDEVLLDIARRSLSRKNRTNKPIDINQVRIQKDTEVMVRNLENLLEMAKKGELQSVAVGFEHKGFGAGQFWSFIDGNCYHLTGILDAIKMEMLLMARENYQPIQTD